MSESSGQHSATTLTHIAIIIGAVMILHTHTTTGAAEPTAATGQPLLMLIALKDNQVIALLPDEADSVIHVTEVGESVGKLLVAPNGTVAWLFYRTSVEPRFDSTTCTNEAGIQGGNNDSNDAVRWIKRAGISVALVTSDILGNGCSDFSLAPSGTKLLYTKATTDKGRSLKFMDLKTGKTETLVENSDVAGPCFSPDGGKIAWFVVKPKDKEAAHAIAELWVRDVKSNREWVIAEARVSQGYGGSRILPFVIWRAATDVLILAEPGESLAYEHYVCRIADGRRSELKKLALNSPPPPEVWGDIRVFVDDNGIYKWVAKGDTAFKDYLLPVSKPFTARISLDGDLVALATIDTLKVVRLSDGRVLKQVDGSFLTGDTFAWTVISGKSKRPDHATPRQK